MHHGDRKSTTTIITTHTPGKKVYKDTFIPDKAQINIDILHPNLCIKYVLLYSCHIASPSYWGVFIPFYMSIDYRT